MQGRSFEIPDLVRIEMLIISILYVHPLHIYFLYQNLFWVYNDFAILNIVKIKQKYILKTVTFSNYNTLQLIMFDYSTILRTSKHIV